MATTHLETLPADLSWLHEPVAWTVEGGDALNIEAGAATDWFFNPDGSQRIDNAPAALFPSTDTAFTLSAQVQVSFGATYDAGTLQVRINEEVWAKLCFEFSPQGQPMVVSVVTRGLSDDSNAAIITGSSVYLRVTRQETIFAFHYSLDGRFWHFVRYFSLGALGDEPLRVGFAAQSPTGAGCTATFTQIRYMPRAVADLRSGE
jgi:regulation of enolase protein 1 (concanavalin A-like superfamily)